MRLRKGSQRCVKRSTLPHLHQNEQSKKPLPAFLKHDCTGLRTNVSARSMRVVHRGCIVVGATTGAMICGRKHAGGALRGSAVGSRSSDFFMARKGRCGNVAQDQTRAANEGAREGQNTQGTCGGGETSTRAAAAASTTWLTTSFLAGAR